MARTFPSHDWHVQPSCQRPNRFPPERRVFSPEGSDVQLSSLRSTGRVRDPSPHKKLLCPRNLIKLLALLLACQPIAPTGFPLEIHIGNWTETVSLLRDRTADGGCPHASCGSSESLCARNRTHLPLCCAAGSNVRFGASAFGTGLFSQSRAEDSWLRKDLFGGSCENRLNPSRTAVPESKPRGRG